MSVPFRHPTGSQSSVPVDQTSVPTRMILPVSGPQPIYQVVPTAYGMLPQPQQYLPQAMIYPQTLPNMQPRIQVMRTVTPNMPGMFLPTGLNPSAVDPNRFVEQQRRIEKERNFQLQQQRLKQFTVAGRKGSLNAENLIDSMFGKCQTKKSSLNSSSSYTKSVQQIKPENKTEISVPKMSPILQEEEEKKCIPNSPKLPVQKDVKDLGTMMLECSDLTGPQKANKFHKPLVKELPPSSGHGATFTTSEKARDWRSVQGFDQVFVAEKPKFPKWCTHENVPALYKEIKLLVTNPDTHLPDTNLLFPILVSSGLPRERLGQIWELVNETGRDHLITEEMYAVLALIALVQIGHPVTSLDILHQLPSCPIPVFNYGNPSTSSKVTPEVKEFTENRNILSSEANREEQSILPHEVMRPNAIFSAVSKNNDENCSVAALGDISSWTPFSSSGFVSSPDDEFDDFKSATPTAVNVLLSTPSTVPVSEDDEFDDFKQAPSLPIENSKIELEIQNPEQDLMSPDDDKYSVFRSLQSDHDASNWGNLASNVPAVNVDPVNYFELNNNKSDEKISKFVTGSPNILINDNSNVCEIVQSGVTNSSKNDDDFGDFLHAAVPTTLSSQTDTDFADFSNFKQPKNQSTFLCSTEGTQIDDEFGDFASSVPVSLKPETGHEFFFRQMKDNISLAESQSVSSLELGTFDGGGQSGESKSSLSRQDSIPSLDLKSGCLETIDAEDVSGELQASVFNSRGSKSPSPSKDIKSAESNESFCTNMSMPFSSQSSIPLADKYSVIRSEERKEEDQHISSWVRCLQSSVNILQNTRRIFNQMSCSSVCNEVLSSEEGANYVKNIIEVYKVVCRIAVASKSAGKQTVAVVELLNEADQEWNTICGFFAGSSLMPEEEALNFSNYVLRADAENSSKACGLCLLSVDIKRKTVNKEENLKLSYGGRNYHCPCANFWVNCVDPLLPALPLPQLL